MSAEFDRRNQAQFARAKAGLQEVGRRFIYFAAEKLEEETPGFGNQYAGTRYIPTGRLRGGLNWTRAPIGSTDKGYKVARHEGGPFSDYGIETLQRIRGQLAGKRVGGISYLENDIAYGWDIITASHNHAHIGKRDFPLKAAVHQAEFARKAMGGAL